jgi:lipopolysaccharide export system protein LptA
MNNTFKTALATSLLTLLLCASAMVNAAQNSQEKIFIDADHVHFNIESGYSVYTGNVKISQGELTLTGDRVTVQQNNNEVEQITVIGKPAHYHNLTEKGETVEAESEHMLYTASENKLLLTINAEVRQPDQTIKSQRIVYDTEKKIATAGNKDASTSDGPIDANQRVRITLTPKKETPEKP